MGLWGCEGAWPPVSPHQSSQERRGWASPVAPSLSFRPLCNGRNQSSRAQSRAPGSFSSSSSLTAQGGGHHPSPSVQVGKRGAPGQRWCWSPPAVPHRPLPTSLTTAGMGEEEPGGGAEGWRRAGGGTPTGSGIVPGAAIQRNTGCQALPPTIVAAAVAAAQPRPLLGGTGEQSAGQGPSPSPWTSSAVVTWPLLTTPARAAPMAGSLLHAPQVVFKVPSCPFRPFPTLRLAQMAPPPGSPSLPNPGQMPPFRLTQPLWVSPTAALTSWSLPHQTGSEPPCTGLGAEVSPLKQFQGPLTPRTP